MFLKVLKWTATRLQTCQAEEPSSKLFIVFRGGTPCGTCICSRYSAAWCVVFNKRRRAVRALQWEGPRRRACPAPRDEGEPEAPVPVGNIVRRWNFQSSAATVRTIIHNSRVVWTRDAANTDPGPGGGCRRAPYPAAYIRSDYKDDPDHIPFHL